MHGISKPRSGRLFAASALVGVAGCFIAASAAQAQVGPPVAASASGGPARAYSWTPRVSVQGTYTDNVLLDSVNRKSDFVTQLAVGLDAVANTPRLTANLTADASYDIYAQTNNLNGWSVNALGTGALSLVRDVLAIEAEGQIQTGAISTFGEPAVDRTTQENRVQVGIFSIGPRLTTTVGSLADFEASARANQVSFRTADASITPDTPEDSTYVTVDASLDTKARYNSYQLVASTQYAADDNDFETYNAIVSGYLRISPRVRVLARGGYETVTQPGVVDLQEPVWSVGAEFAPNQNSLITIEAGERYDRPSYALDAVVEVSDKLLLTARYFEQIQPAQLALGAGFAGFVGQAAILPVGFVPGTFDIQGNLNDETSLQKTADAHLIYRWPTQMIDLSIYWTDQYFLDSLTHDRSVAGEVRYQRMIRPDLTAEARGRYERTYASPTFGESRSYNMQLSLLYALRATTQISVGYAYQDSRQLGVLNGRVYENAVFVALRRTF